MATTTVFLEGLVVSCLIGVPKSERDKRQPIKLDISCELGQVRIDHDQLSQTLNYANLHRQIRGLAADKQFVLLETLTEVIAHLCFQDKRVLRVTIKAGKPRKLENCELVGTIRTFDRSELQS